MRRFYELATEIRKRFPADDFFLDFEHSLRLEPAKRKHYRPYNEALELLDDESWQNLKEKALNQFGNERTGQRKEAFFNTLNEAFGYKYLQSKGFSDIRLMKECKDKRPDISYLEQEKQHFCEVKTVGISDAEIRRREGAAVYDGWVYVRLNDVFFNKLASHVNEAWQQIHALGKDGLVFIVVRFDDIALDRYRTYRRQFIEFCSARAFKHLVIKMGHRGNRRICF